MPFYIMFKQATFAKEYKKYVPGWLAQSKIHLIQDSLQESTRQPEGF